jgi:hypothetical protein
MNGKLVLRVVLDLTALALFLLALAYYWLDNATHEIAGTAMFVLLVVHNVLNRQWYRAMPKRQEARKTVDKVLVLGMLATLATLVVTSVMISQTVFALVAAPDAFTARRIHVLAAYWTLLFVAVHLGIRWRIVLGLVTGVLGSGSSRLRNALMGLSTAIIAAAGIYSSFQIGVGGKLVSRLSLDGWDFAESAGEFFLHHIAIVGLYAYLADHSFRRFGRGQS